MNNTSITKNLKKHTVDRQASLSEILDLIKNGIDEDHIANQQKLRLSDKSKQSKLKEKFACYTPHASFNYVNNNQSKDLSGVVYIDLDDISDIWKKRSELAKNEYVHACYTSISGTGLGIWVKINTTNLTADDYRGDNSIMDQVAKMLEVKIDRNARGIARMNIIPYDPFIYINNNSKIFQPELTKKTTKEDIRKYLHGDTNERYLTQTLLNDYNGQEYIVIPEGQGYMDTYIVNRAIPEGRRNSTLRAIAVANIFNNSQKPEKAHLGRLVNINNEYCKSPLTYNEVLAIHSSIWKQYVEGKLIFKLKNKYVWFSPKSSLTKKEKLSIAAKEGGKIRSDRTKKEIREVIEKMYEEEILISQKNVAETTGKSIRTIKRHWPEFKNEVKQINNLLKNDDAKTSDTIRMEKTEMDNSSICGEARPSNNDGLYQASAALRLGSNKGLQAEQKSTEGPGYGFHINRNNKEMGGAGAKVKSQQLDTTENEDIMKIKTTISQITKMKTEAAKLSVPLFSQAKFLDQVRELDPSDLIDLEENNQIVRTLTAKTYIEENEESMAMALPF